jgi:hypothetical protein
MKNGEYAQFCATVQMNKAIPLLLSVNDNLLSMNDKMDSMNDKMDSMNIKMGSMNDKMDAIVHGQEDTTEEIRGLRDDLAIRNNIEWQKRMEKDIRIIKSKMGIR